ncbi:MAG: helix-turn-helix transcriptional regulator [Clostridia bacterium]|nr:helix-turn-helix transcriptional regulator [Clostridia bacterium]
MRCYFESCGSAVEYATASKSFGLFYSECEEPNSEIHIHECCELLLCLSGGQNFLIDNNVYDINDGDLFMINQFEAHKITAHPDTGFARYIMHIHPTYLYANSCEGTNLGDCFYNFSTGTHNRIRLTGEEIGELTELFSELQGDHEYGDGFRKRMAANRILFAVNRMNATHSEAGMTTSRHRTVQLAIDYINNNYSGELTLDTISKNAYVSANQLCKLFKMYCNTTVSKYIVSKRITEAKKMLAEGRSVTDTAFMCGFNDYANFIRVFKKTVGTPPGKYRASIS